MIKILEIRFEVKSRKKEIRNISGKQKYYITFKIYDKIFEKIDQVRKFKENQE